MPDRQYVMHVRQATSTRGGGRESSWVVNSSEVRLMQQPGLVLTTSRLSRASAHPDNARGRLWKGIHNDVTVLMLPVVFVLGMMDHHPHTAGYCKQSAAAVAVLHRYCVFVSQGTGRV
jgi:hypothetical protein